MFLHMKKFTLLICYQKTCALSCPSRTGAQFALVHFHLIQLLGACLAEVGSWG